MKAQFYICQSPIDPNDKENIYIYHAKTPRFHAQVVWHGSSFSLQAVDNIDGAEESRIEGKMKRMKDWYIQVIQHEKNKKGA